jgi:hypothetical protein
MQFFLWPKAMRRRLFTDPRGTSSLDLNGNLRLCVRGCVRVCMRVCALIYIYIYIYIYIMYMYVYIYMYIYLCACVHGVALMSAIPFLVLFYMLSWGPWAPPPRPDWGRRGIIRCTTSRLDQRALVFGLRVCGWRAAQVHTDGSRGSAARGGEE